MENKMRQYNLNNDEMHDKKLDGLEYAHLWKKWDTNINASFGS